MSNLLSDDTDGNNLWQALYQNESEEVNRHRNSSTNNNGSNNNTMGNQFLSKFFPSRPRGTAVPKETKQNLSDFGLEGVELLTEPPSSTLYENRNNFSMPTPSGVASSSNVVPDRHNYVNRRDSDISHEDRRSDYVFLSSAFRSSNLRKEWGAVGNLDLFFTSIYNYYYYRGFVPIVCNGLVELVTLFCTLILSVLLFGYVDWSSLAMCKDEHTCKDNFGDYLISSSNSHGHKWSSLMVILLRLYVVLFFVYSCGAVVTFWSNVQDALDAKDFYENKLGISKRRLGLGDVEWDDIVKKIVELQTSGKYRIAIAAPSASLEKEVVTALNIAQRVLRKENWMVALFNQGSNLLDLRVPWISTYYAGKSTSGAYMSTVLEWSIHVCVLGFMYNHNYRIRPTFLDPSTLQRRFIMCGVAQAVFMPFLLLFMILHFLLLNMHDWRSNKDYMGPREWTNSARWTFREFNELPHLFERRIAPSYKAADEYLALFAPNAIITSIGRVVVFLSGSLLASLLVMAFIDESILIHVKVGNWNLLWYVGILGVIFSIGKAMLPNAEVHKPQYHKNYFVDMNSALHQVGMHTHHFPSTWKGLAWKNRVYKQFTSLYVYKSQIFLLEILSVLFSPLVLCFSLPRCSTKICDFVRRVKVEHFGMGEVCGYSTFDFERFEDEKNWQGSDGPDSDVKRDLPMGNHNMNENGTLFSNSKPRARHGKMEKSFFSFKVRSNILRTVKSISQLAGL